MDDSNPQTGSSRPIDGAPQTDAGQVALKILENLPNGVYAVDGQWRLIFFNDAACRRFGVKRDQVIGKDLWTALPGLMGGDIETCFRRVMATRREEDFVIASLFTQGLWFETRMFPVFDGVGVVFRDVTPRIRTQEALEAGEERLRLALEGAAMGDWSWDALTDEISMPARTRAIYGLDDSVTDMKRESLLRERAHPDDIGPARAASDRALAENGRYIVEYRVRHGAAWRWVRVMGRATYDDGRIVGMNGLMQDISERKRAEHRLQVAHRAARACTWEWDLAANTLTWTDLEAAKTLFGDTIPDRQVLSPSEWRAMIHPEDTGLGLAAFSAELRTGSARGEFRLKGEPLRWVEPSGQVAEYDEAGQPARISGVSMDITERKATEAALRAEIQQRKKAQQHQTLLIHELNHRVKNTLAMVQAIAAQTLWSAADPQAARTALESRLIALSRAHDVLTRESWDGAGLLDVIASAVTPYEDEPGSRFRIQGPALWLEPKTAVSLAMALHELATNAVKYGALSTMGGWVQIDWTLEPEQGGLHLFLSWREHDGPPVSPPTRQGFGTRLIERSLAAELGEAKLHYDPAGLRCEILAVLPDLQGSGA
jgi:PAS domain S-box-containing protein